MAVYRQCRIRLVTGEHEVDGLACRTERRILQRPLWKARRVSRRDQQQVALAERNLEPLGKPENHLPAGQRPAGLDKAQMLCRDISVAGKCELTEAAPLPPFTQMPADRSGCPLHRGKGYRKPRSGPITSRVILSLHWR